MDLTFLCVGKKHCNAGDLTTFLSHVVTSLRPGPSSLSISKFIYRFQNSSESNKLVCHSLLHFYRDSFKVVQLYFDVGELEA